MPQVGTRQKATMAVIFAAGAATLAAADAAVVRALDGAVHPFVIGFFRAVFGAVVLLPFSCAALIAARSGTATGRASG